MAKLKQETIDELDKIFGENLGGKNPGKVCGVFTKKIEDSKGDNKSNLMTVKEALLTEKEKFLNKRTIIKETDDVVYLKIGFFTITLSKNSIAYPNYKRNEKPKDHISVKQLSNILDRSENTILNLARKHFPEIIRNGKTTYLNKNHISIIKKEITERGVINE